MSLGGGSAAGCSVCTRGDRDGGDVGREGEGGGRKGGVGVGWGMGKEGERKEGDLVRFGCFKPSLFFLLTSSPHFSRHRLWTISQNALSCFAVDPLRRIVRVVESSWSSRAQVELWFPLGHWILTLFGNAPGCAGAAMGPGTLWWLLGFEIPSFDLFSRRGLRCCLHLHVGWMRRSGCMVQFLLRLLCVVASFRAGSSFWDPWVVYSPSPLQPPWGHFPLLTDVVKVILVAD